MENNDIHLKPFLAFNFILAGMLFLAIEYNLLTAAAVFFIVWGFEIGKDNNNEPTTQE